MYKKSKLFVVFGIIVIFVIGIVYVASFYSNTYTFKLNNENKYKIETAMKWKTMQNDGGSHTNIYYNVDFENNVISKIVEDYQANLGGKTKHEVSEIYNKKLDFELQKDLKLLLVELMEKEDINENKNYNFVTIYNLNNEKIIYNLNSIEKINEVLELIDKL